jgi:tetratricopeptide (TPR) repeat protein
MDKPSTRDEAPNAVDDKMMKLIESHRSAIAERDFAAADRLGIAALDLALEAVFEDAKRGKVSQDFLLSIEASECEDNGDWDGAIAVYRRALEVAQTERGALAWKARDDLASLHYLLGDYESAIREQKLATAAARRDELGVFQRTAYVAEATLLLRLDRTAEASLSVHDGLTVPNDSEPIDELGPARLRVLQAGCEVGFGHVAEARQILQDVYPVLQPAEEMPSAAGYHSALRTWWWVEAKCCEVENNSAGEVNALRKSLAIARHIANLPHCSNVYTKAQVMHSLLALAQALWRKGNFDAARQARQESEKIRTALKLPRSSPSQ